MVDYASIVFRSITIESFTLWLHLLLLSHSGISTFTNQQMWSSVCIKSKKTNIQM